MYVGETVTDLQILGCELHQNASGGLLRELLRSPDPWPLLRGRMDGKEKVGIGKGTGLGLGRDEKR